MIKEIILIVMFCVGVITVTAQSEKKEVSNEEVEVSAMLSGVVFVTTELEASVKFYKEFLGFKEHKRIVLDTPAGIAPFGFESDKKLNYVTLVPHNFSKENPSPGLSFVEEIGAKKEMFLQDGKRKLIEGESVKGYWVKGLKIVEEKMKKAGVTFVTPLQKSPSGKSMILTVIDPNGIRIQMYEYIKK